MLYTERTDGWRFDVALVMAQLQTLCRIYPRCFDEELAPRTPLQVRSQLSYNILLEIRDNPAFDFEGVPFGDWYPSLLPRRENNY
jgi:hypothetical protein